MFTYKNPHVRRQLFPPVTPLEKRSLAHIEHQTRVLDITTIISPTNCESYTGGNVYLGSISDLEDHIKRYHPKEPVVIFNAAAQYTPVGRFRRGLPFNNLDKRLSDITPCPELASNIITAKVTISGTEHNLYNIEIDDSPEADIAAIFDIITDDIYDHCIGSRKHIYICCAAGISRSATLLAAYIIKYSVLPSVTAALEFIKESRPQVNPNPGFIKQLQEFHLMQSESPLAVESSMADGSMADPCTAPTVSKPQDAAEQARSSRARAGR